MTDGSHPYRCRINHFGLAGHLERITNTINGELAIPIEVNVPARHALSGTGIMRNSGTARLLGMSKVERNRRARLRLGIKVIEVAAVHGADRPGSRALAQCVASSPATDPDTSVPIADEPVKWWGPGAATQQPPRGA